MARKGRKRRKQHREAQNPYQAPEAVDGEPSRGSIGDLLVLTGRTPRQSALWRMLLIGAVGAFLSGLLHDTLLGILIPLSTYILLIATLLTWCTYDCAALGMRRWRHLGLSFFLCPGGPLVVVPIYFFVTRGVGGFLATFVAFIFTCILFADVLLCLMLGYWIAA